jgi:flagellar hook-associated protein 2
MASSTSSTSSATDPNALTFTGTSRYSSDFQNVITRAVAIASLPITNLDNDLTQLNSQATALGTLSTDFSNLSNAVGTLTSSVGSSSYSVDISDPTVASATVDTGAMEGTYSIEVTALGAYSTATSSNTGLTKVTDPTSQNLSTASNFTLTVGTSNYSITPTGNTLDDLADAINASSANVQATVVNIGSTSAPDYRLSLQNGVLGTEGLQLDANTTSSSKQPVSTPLMTTGVTGSLASYQVNGSSEVDYSDSRNVTIAPGLNVTMLAQSAANTPTSITVTLDSSAIDTALQGFVKAYNTAVDDVKAQRGQSGGALSGDSVVYELQDALNQLTSTYDSGGTIKSLADLGITFDQSLNGHLDYDEDTFLSAAFSNMNGVSAFLGDGTTNGFLLNATNTMSSVTDPTEGFLTTAINANQTTITNDDNRITTEQAQVNTMQTNLVNQMDQADALISEMEQQYDVLSNIFSAMASSDGTTSGTSTTTNSLA